VLFKSWWEHAALKFNLSYSVLADKQLICDPNKQTDEGAEVIGRPVLANVECWWERVLDHRQQMFISISAGPRKCCKTKSGHQNKLASRPKLKTKSQMKMEPNPDQSVAVDKGELEWAKKWKGKMIKCLKCDKQLSGWQATTTQPGCNLYKH